MEELVDLISVTQLVSGATGAIAVLIVIAWAFATGRVLPRSFYDCTNSIADSIARLTDCFEKMTDAYMRLASMYETGDVREMFKANGRSLADK